jgi:hypothetical protein
MLNKVLTLIDKRGFFADLTPEEAQNFLREIVKIGKKYDCNQGEILENIGERMGICYCCMKPAESFEHGLCPSCI